MASSQAERRTGSERREEILAVSLDLFARHGLHGVTTRMIADAAGISEALLYRHFRSKEALYDELQRSCLRTVVGAAERLAQLEPGTPTLVLAIYFIVRQSLQSAEGPARAGCIKRILLGSLIGDGTFARGFLKVNFVRFVPKLIECMEAARRAGDLEDRPRHPDVRIWLVHHVAVMTSHMRLPDPPAVDHGLSDDARGEEVTRFALRGVGLTEAAIARHFAPRALAASTARLVAESQQEPTPSPARREEGAPR